MGPLLVSVSPVDREECYISATLSAHPLSGMDDGRGIGGEGAREIRSVACHFHGLSADLAD